MWVIGGIVALAKLTRHGHKNGSFQGNASFNDLNCIVSIPLLIISRLENVTNMLCYSLKNTDLRH